MLNVVPFCAILRQSKPSLLIQKGIFMKHTIYIILLVSTISTTNCMDRRKKGFDQNWGDKTCAVRGTDAQIKNSIPIGKQRFGDEIEKTYQKIAEVMRNKGETPASLRLKAAEAEKADKSGEAATLRRLASVLTQIQQKEKGPQKNKHYN